VNARLVVDAAAVGVPLDEWRSFTVRERAAITQEHNRRITRKR